MLVAARTSRPVTLLRQGRLALPRAPKARPHTQLRAVSQGKTPGKAGPEKAGVHLYSFGTPNGWKASIALEELGLPYCVHKINLREGEQRSKEYLEINPVGKIPAIVDYDAGGVKVFESGAILCYLADSRDPQHTLLPLPLGQRTEVLSWLFFQNSTFQPQLPLLLHPLMMGSPTTKEQLEKSAAELKRLLGVLDARLGAPEGKGFLAAGRYTVADIAHIGTVLVLSTILGLKLESDHPAAYPHLASWFQRVMARPAVQRGLKVPEGGLLADEQATREMAEKVVKAAKEHGIEL